MIKEVDFLFKLVLIGDAGVGKSSILTRFTDENFQENYLSTLGVDFKFKSMEIEKKHVKLQIWDTAGQERFRTITNVYFKNSNSIILTYDMTCRLSYQNLSDFWLGQVENHADEGVQLVLLGNKSDLKDQQVVTTEEAQLFANQHSMLFFEVSAKTDDQVTQCFTKVSQELLNINTQKDFIQTNLDAYNIDKKQSNVCGSSNGCC